ncbi:ABC transporter ATP-binding protein [Candidatus Clostridium stratigraminis]|uniref:Spermidine/putrescine import ATP-binding protein PotA n=1 Tax=Candidatus Clostridium stratigraminis TaxID=3381661 RepID=A0ABW8T6F5_9CLOT
MTGEAIIRLVNTVKSFGNGGNAAVKGISLDVMPGEFLTILGPSGCGKTTTLRLIAGFEKPTEGNIFIGNEDVISEPPYRRNVNTVFQNYALFPHMNVFDNIAFGLTMKKLPKNEIKSKVEEMLKIVQLDGYENRMPSQLSGGQKQRVAIARAVINNPKVLLLDEPLGALDLKLRKQMQIELKHLRKRLGITFVFVTHDQEEALTMSDRIVVMNNGYIEQVASPEEIYERPKTKFVADFIGETNIFEGYVTEVDNDRAMLKINDDQKVRIKDIDLSIGELACIAVRPERLRIKNVPENGDEYIKAKLKERIYAGSAMRTVVTTADGKDVVVDEKPGEIFDFESKRQEIFVTWSPKSAVVMKA